MEGGPWTAEKALPALEKGWLEYASTFDPQEIIVVPIHAVAFAEGTEGVVRTQGRGPCALGPTSGSPWRRSSVRRPDRSGS